MGAKRLNVRQERFAQELSKGTTQRQAYLLAYPNSQKWKPDSVDKRATALANTTVVLRRLEELKRETERQNGLSRQAVIDQLKALGFVDIPVRRVRAADKLKALELIVRILGYEKQGGEGEVNVEAHRSLVRAIRGLTDAAE